MSDLDLSKAQHAIRSVIAKADPAPVREMTLVKQLHLDATTVRRVLEGLQAAGEIISCTLFADGIEQLEVKLATAAGGPAKFSQQFIVLSARSAADNKRRSDQIDAETKGLLRIPGSAGLKMPPRILANLAHIGPTEPAKPVAAQPLPASFLAGSLAKAYEPAPTTTQETRTMSKGTQPKVLAALIRLGGEPTATQIAESVGLSGTQVSNALSNLKKAGKADKGAGQGWKATAAGATANKAGGDDEPATATPKRTAKPAKKGRTKAPPKVRIGADASKATKALEKAVDALPPQPVNIMKLEGGDVLVLRGNLVKAQLDQEEVAALRKAA